MLSHNLKKAISLCAAVASVLFLSACTSATSSTPPSSLSTVSSAVSEANSWRMTQQSTVRKKSYEKVSAYQDFLALASPCGIIPGLKEGLVPQGMDFSESDGRLYISGYYIADLPSALVVLDSADNTFIAEYNLYNPDGSPFVSHVGGVAVTDTTLYVSAALDNDGSYSIAAIPLSELAKEGSHDLVVQQKITVPVSPSFLNYSQGILWLGNFYHPSQEYGLPTLLNQTTTSADGDYGCYILGYRLDASQALPKASDAAYPIPDFILAAPDRIQGMTMADDQTVWLSQSYGRKSDATLLAYDVALTEAPDTTLELGGKSIPAFVLDSSRKKAELTAMPMTEALASGLDGHIWVLFESGATKYSDGKNRTDCVWSLNPQQ